MIKKFGVSNFYSVGSWQEVSFLSWKKDQQNQSTVEASNSTFVNAVNCFVGHNASGKTTVMKALSFLNWFANESYGTWKDTDQIPIDPHELHRDEPTRFEATFDLHGREFRYELILNQEVVLYEFFGVKKERGHSYILKLDRRDGRQLLSTSKDLPAFNLSDRKRFLQQENLSLFSFLKGTGYLAAINVNSLFGAFQTNVSQLGRVKRVFNSEFVQLSERLRDDEDLLLRTREYIKSFDFGISDLSVTTVKVPEDHETAEREIPVLYADHKGTAGGFSLSLIDESNGTQAAISLLSRVLPILDQGGIAVFDELESSLHPLITRKFISLFESRKSNPKFAQLIFTTHNSNFLTDRTKSQIFLVEKPESLSSEVFRLDEIDGVRSDENFAQKYLAGEYGGIGQLTWY